jgi:hypothetical protein
MIETFIGHIIAGTQYFSSHGTIGHSEKSIRFLAREPRFRRRVLATALLGLLEKTPANIRGTRVLVPTRSGDPHYLFLLVPHLATISYEEYRDARRRFLDACLKVLKVVFPDALDIVGFATESGRTGPGSEDVAYFDAREWTSEEDAEARQLQKDLGILTNTTFFHGTDYEYPIDEPRYQEIKLPGSQRNKQCPCGSGRKYKYCHGR